jgi:diguanylate cyclase (GGDEF)-like protein
MVAPGDGIATAGELRAGSPWRSFLVNLSLIVVISVSALFVLIVANDRKATELELQNRARTLFNSILLAREWNASYGGVYVERTPGMQSNPYLKTEALRSFERGKAEATGRSIRDGSTWYRYMAPLFVDSSCLECHAHQGYQLGDVRGGISVSFNIDGDERAGARNRWIIIGLYVLTVLVLLAILWRLVTLMQGRLAAAEARIREMAITDDLTGLRNRRYILGLLTDELARALRYGRPLSCVMFDVDHFKRINDTYGHVAGDAVLSAISAAARAQCRHSDALGRYGGEEFLLILPETTAEGARSMGERIRQAIEDLRIEHAGAVLTVTASFGSTTVLPVAEADVSDPKAVLKRADDALYRAKYAGRNRVESDGKAA